MRGLIGMQGLAERFEEIDSASPFVIALIIVMVITALQGDISVWLEKQPVGSPASKNEVRGERLIDPVGRYDQNQE